MRRVLMLIAVSLAITGGVSYVQATSPQQPSSRALAPSVAPQRAFIDRYCVTCHNDKLRTRGTVPVSFEAIDIANVSAAAEDWEKVVRKLRGGLMPPVGQPRPDQATYDGFVSWLETKLDDAATAPPSPGRNVIRRLNRAEYVNSIRDLLALEINEQSLLFPDDNVDRHGFDTNGEVLSLSPVLLERYMAAARTISRLVTGDSTIGPSFAAGTYKVHKKAVQDDRLSEDLPFGSRGGIAIRHYFPLDGEYSAKIRLRRQVYDYVIGMGTAQHLDVFLDGQRITRFTVGGAAKGKPSARTFFGTIRGDPEWEKYVSLADDGLEIRFAARAGMRVMGVTFAQRQSEPEGVLEPRAAGRILDVDDNYYGNAGVESVAIAGPYQITGTAETPSRRKIFVCRPTGPGDEESCAEKILSTVARRAYRRPISDEDIGTLLGFYRRGRREGGFETGVQRALERLLVDPEFLYSIERDPADLTPENASRLSDLELASRLSFFLWSSIPDDELVDVAVRGKLKDPTVLERQVRRMLGDARSKALVDNFASQWLELRKMRGVFPEPEVFPDFDESLRRDFEQETTLFVESTLREDRSVVDLLTANYTFVNERLARHYGIPNIYGEHFRRVTLNDQNRAGLLGHGSVLTLTSYPTRTSPVLRGKWVLDRLLAMPPPPPPPNVPALEATASKQGDKVLSVREQMEQHRANPACAGCHKIMDPLGFALENFDAIGKWRTNEAGTPINASGVLADGTGVDGPATLRQALVNRREDLVRAFTEKLLMYALARGVEFYDAPAVRKVAREAVPHNYRWSAIILGIVKSRPFQMRGSA